MLILQGRMTESHIQYFDFIDGIAQNGIMSRSTESDISIFQLQDVEYFLGFPPKMITVSQICHNILIYDIHSKNV